MKPVAALAAISASLSLAAFGGANAVVPALARQVVDVHRWMSGRDFAGLFALGQAAPGPNLLVFTLVGWHVAGLAGALSATLAFILPSALLAYAAQLLWQRAAVRAPWRAGVQTGLGALAAGLVGASAITLVHASATSFADGAIVAGTAAGATLTRWNPLIFLAAAAVLGLAFRL